jgi:hypothetical protein
MKKLCLICFMGLKGLIMSCMALVAKATPTIDDTKFYNP